MANNLVPESDLRAVLQGINNKLQEICVTETKLEPLLVKASDSIRENLTRLVQPISDEEYGAYTRIADAHIHEESDDDSVDEDHVDDESEDSEDDLIDRDAHSRARALRNEVRAASARVAALRHETMTQAAALVSIVNEETEKSWGMEDTTKWNLNELEDEWAFTWKELKGVLHEMESTLPPAWETLQSTVETVDQELAKQPAAFSQTEQAILSRENEGRMMEVRSSDDIDVEDDVEQRLANFLSQY